MFDSLCGVSGFLLSVVMLKDIYDSHEVNLLPGSSCGFKQKAPWMRTYFMFAECHQVLLKRIKSFCRLKHKCEQQRPAGGALGTLYIIKLLNKLHRLDLTLYKSMTHMPLLTVIAFDGVDVDGGIKLSGGQRLVAVQGVAGAVGGRSNTPSVTLALLVGVVVFALHVFLLSSLHIVDPNQQTVVHELQLGQELRTREDGRGNQSRVVEIENVRVCVVMWMNTYLHIFPEFLQEHLLVLRINVDLLSVIDEVVVLVGGQLLGLPISIGD